jgi:diguanylate cyclase (GGDEF)-like protein
VENRKYYQVVDELASLRKASPFNLRFTQLMEYQFQQSYGLWYRDAIRVATLFAAALLGGAHIVQWLSGLSVHPFVELGRLGSIGMLISTYVYVARSKRLIYQHLLVNINALVATLVILSFCLSYPAPFKHIFYTAIIFVQIFVFALIRMPFVSAFLGALVILAASNAAIYYDGTPVAEWFFLTFFLVAGAVLSLVICYRMERGARESHLQSMLVSMERDQLKLQNTQLKERLSEDPVTHLLNRRTFENAVLDKWNRAFHNRKESALVAISVESLKQLNQMRGSDAGDDLLKSVARQIKKILFESDDVAARISGGRFCVLLSNASNSEITRRMKRLRKGLLSISVLQEDEISNAGIRISVATNVLVPDAEGDSRDAIVRVMRDVEPMFFVENEQDADVEALLAS